jgi:GNAT superfamily N-acetyltransferase
LTNIDSGASPLFTVEPLTATQSGWVRQLVTARWGAEIIAVHGELLRPADLPGYIAVDAAGSRVGLVTFRVDGAGDCEIVTLDGLLHRGAGVGTALVTAVRRQAETRGCRRLWLVTTNDNLDAIRFYQRRGFALVSVHRGAVERARVLKPGIPTVGAHGIPVRDEVELEVVMSEARSHCDDRTSFRSSRTGVRSELRKICLSIFQR